MWVGVQKIQDHTIRGSAVWCTVWGAAGGIRASSFNEYVPPRAKKSGSKGGQEGQSRRWSGFDNGGEPTFGE